MFAFSTVARGMHFVELTAAHLQYEPNVEGESSTMSRPRTDANFTTLQLDHLAANEESKP